MRFKGTGFQPAVDEVTGGIQLTDPSIFEKVKTFLEREYKRARNGQDVIFCSESYRGPSEALDGPGGAAFLTELFYFLGGCMAQRREFFKRMLVAAAWSLKMPMLIQPSGIVSLRLSPRGDEPKIASWIEGLVKKGLPLPTEIQTSILAFAGQVWVSQRGDRVRNLASFTASYAIECPQAKVRRLLKAVLPFSSAVLTFSDVSKVYVEWGENSQYLWALGGNLWPLIVLLRCQRNARGQAAIPLCVRGFGTVLV